MPKTVANGKIDITNKGKSEHIPKISDVQPNTFPELDGSLLFSCIFYTNLNNKSQGYC